MKRIGFLLLTASLCNTGCFLTDAFVTRRPEPEKVAEPPPPPPVTPENITEHNAQDKARALRLEMERESRPPSQPASSPTGPLPGGEKD
jgi:hypothetical protein